MTNLTKYEMDDILEAVKEYLKWNLKIEIDKGDFTNPNDRKISVVLGGEVIAEEYFDVVQKPKYEG